MTGAQGAKKLAAGMLVLLALLSVYGCQTVTPAQSAKLKREAAEKEKAELARKESEARVSELDAREEQLKKKAEAVRAAIEREEQLNAAIACIGAADPQGAVTITNALIEQADSSNAADASQAATDGTTPQPPPPVSPQERARIYLVRGNALHELGEGDHALECYRRAHELDPSNRSCRINLGKLLFKAERYREALDVWNLEFKDGYRSGELLFLTAQAFYHLAIAEKAKAEPGAASTSDAYFEAARLAVAGAFLESPDDPDLLKWMAILEFETGRDEEAIRLLKRLLTNSPLNPEYLELIANCHVRQTNYMEAVNAFEQAARVKTPSRAMCISMSDLYGQANLAERAADWMLRGYGDEMEKASTADRLALAGYLFDSGRNEEAIRWLKTIEKGTPQYTEARSLLGRLLIEVGRDEEAIQVVDETRALRPSEGVLHLLAGDLRLSRRELDPAEEAYSVASALPKTDADGLAGLGEVAYARGDLRRAVQCYARAAAARPDERRFRVVGEQIELEMNMKKAASE